MKGFFRKNSFIHGCGKAFHRHDDQVGVQIQADAKSNEENTDGKHYKPSGIAGKAEASKKGFCQVNEISKGKGAEDLGKIQRAERVAPIIVSQVEAR